MSFPVDEIPEKRRLITSVQFRVQNAVDIPFSLSIFGYYWVAKLGNLSWEGVVCVVL